MGGFSRRQARAWPAGPCATHQPAGPAAGGTAAEGGAWHLVASRRLEGWRASLLPLDATANAVPLTDADAAALGLAAGDVLLVSPLQQVLGGREGSA